VLPRQLKFVGSLVDARPLSGGKIADRVLIVSTRAKLAASMIPIPAIL
jgi:hypothetical protein